MKIRNVAIGLVFSVFAASSLASSGLAGRPAPDFALKSSSGQNLRLSEHRGERYAGPDIMELPNLEDEVKEALAKILGS